jgi:hypothetical protein
MQIKGHGNWDCPRIMTNQKSNESQRDATEQEPSQTLPTLVTVNSNAVAGKPEQTGILKLAAGKLEITRNPRIPVLKAKPVVDKTPDAEHYNASTEDELLSSNELDITASEYNSDNQEDHEKAPADVSSMSATTPSPGGKRKQKAGNQRKRRRSRTHKGGRR